MAKNEIYYICLFSSSFLSGNHCQQCQDPCLTCTNLTSCLTCDKNLNILNDQCVENCPDGYYLNNKQCSQCNPMCGTCKGRNRSFVL